MAKWIPEGIDYVAGTRSMSIQLETWNKRFIGRIQKHFRSMSIEPINIVGYPLYITEIKLNVSLGEGFSAECKFIPKEPHTIKDLVRFKINLQKYGNVDIKIGKKLNLIVK